MLLQLMTICIYLLASHFTLGRASPSDISLPVIKDPGLKVEIVLYGLDHPTQMAFLSPADFLVIEKNNGKVIRVINDTALSRPLIDVKVANKIERGLLGLAVSKNLNTVGDSDDEKNKFETKIYLFYTESDKDGNDVCPTYSTCESEPEGNRLYRYDLERNRLVNQKLLLDIPGTRGPDHVGGVIKIGPDNNIYLASGDGDSCPNIGLCTKNDLEGRVLKSQTSNVPDGLPPAGRGGILRVTPDGKPVNGGIIGNNNPLNKYYAYGIRNSFGMDFDPVTGKLWDTENGPFFGDEINLVDEGFNSGWLKVQGMWPVATFNPHAYPNPKYRGYIVNDPLNKDLKFDPRQLVDFNQNGVYSWPEFVWNRTVAPTGLLFLNTDKLGKQYKNDLLVGESNTGTILHFELNKNRTALDLSGPLSDKIANSMDELEQIKFGEDFGVITDLKIGPDGYLYVLSYDRGMVYRVIPSAIYTQ